jgi:hypothetical protein
MKAVMSNIPLMMDRIWRFSFNYYYMMDLRLMATAVVLAVVPPVILPVILPVIPA